jgi:hypothetical protein
MRCGSIALPHSQTFIKSIDWICIIDQLSSQDQCNLLNTSSIRLRCKVLEDTIQKEFTSPNSSPILISNCIRWSMCVLYESHRQNGAKVSAAQEGWDPRRTAVSAEARIAGLPKNIKESIKITPRDIGLSHYITWWGDLQRDNHEIWAQCKLAPNLNRTNG